MLPEGESHLPNFDVPAGFTLQGLPIGVQVIARAYDEPTVLRVAHAYEQATDWHTRKPTLEATPR